MLTAEGVTAILKEEKRDNVMWEITDISEPIDYTELVDLFCKEGDYYWVKCTTNDPTFDDRIHQLVPKMPPQFNNILRYKKYEDGVVQIGLKFIG